MDAKTIEFLFPIDPKWTEEELFKNFYEKIKKYPDIYKMDSVLKQFKRIKKKSLKYLLVRLSTLFKNIGMENEPLPIIYLLIQIIDNTFDVVHTRDLKDDEILVIRFFSIKNPPESSSDMVWYDYIQQRISLENFLE